jgi:hypothetical protein
MTLSMRNAERSKQKSAISLPAKLLGHEETLQTKAKAVELIRNHDLKLESELKLNRSKTMPVPNENFKSTKTTSSSRRKFTDLNPGSKLYDSHKMMSLLKMSVNESSNLPPIVRKQLKKSENDPYIKKVSVFPEIHSFVVSELTIRVSILEARPGVLASV